MLNCYLFSVIKLYRLRRDYIVKIAFFALRKFDEFSRQRSFPNVILTPHTAFYTETTVSNMVEKSFEAIYYYQNKPANPYEIK